VLRKYQALDSRPFAAKVVRGGVGRESNGLYVKMFVDLLSFLVDTRQSIWYFGHSRNARH